MLYRATGRKGRSPQRHKYTMECQRIAPSSNQPSQILWVTIVGPTTASATHTTSQNHCAQNGRTPKAHHRNDTHTQGMRLERNLAFPHPPRPAGLTIVARRPRSPIANSQTHCAHGGRSTTDIWLCTEARHRDGVDMPNAGLHPHHEALSKQHTHTQPTQSRCVPFSDPHAHKVARPIDSRQEYTHSNANTMGQIHHLGDTPGRREVQIKGNKGVHQQRVLW